MQTSPRCNRIIGVSAVLAVSMTSGVVMAQDGGRATSGWNGTASFGANFTRGNAESSSINGSLRLIKHTQRWDHVLTASLFRGDSTVLVDQRDPVTNEVITDENGFVQRDLVEGDNSDRLALGYQPKFYYTNNLYFFGLLDWETDEPSNIDVASRQLIGAGYSFFSGPTGYLTAEAGVGNRVLEPVTGDDLDEGIGYLGVNYLNRFTDTVAFNADLRTDLGSSNTYFELGLGLSFKVSTNFSVKVTNFTRGNTDLDDPGNPLDSDNDNITTINLVLDI